MAPPSFVNVAFGGDAVASTKQADQFGVLKKMRLVVPNISSFQAKEVGAQLMQGVYETFDFWWTVPVVVGKAPGKMQNADDFYEVLEVVAGEQLLSPPGMFGCHLGAYT